MNFIQKGRLRIMLRQVLWVTFFWTLIGALDALYLHSLSNNEYISRTHLYNFERLFWANTLASFFSGLLGGALLIFFLRERFRHKSFGYTLLVNGVLISLFNFFVSTFFFDLFFSLSSGKSPFSPSVIQETTSLLRSSFFTKNLFFWTIIVVLTIIFLNVNEKYGPGVLGKLLLGRYHRPSEEERIFMFVDMKSSTTIAERLGHINFFNLLNDFFRDITNPVIYTSGEVYQYVGDEVVISWTMENGIRNANCIRCFYDMQEAIQKRAKRYHKLYGIIPEFKVGLHCGLVTTGEIGVIKKDIVFSGDVMNTTSRIQSLCNGHKVKILLSKNLLSRLHLPPHSYNPNRVGIIELKGKRQRVELYTLGYNYGNDGEIRTISKM